MLMTAEHAEHSVTEKGETFFEHFRHFRVYTVKLQCQSVAGVSHTGKIKGWSEASPAPVLPLSLRLGSSQVNPELSQATRYRVLEGLWEFAQPVHMCFVDLEKAFDRVPRGILWGVLQRVWGPGAFVRSLYRPEQELGSHCQSVNLFPVHVGLRQGCPLSPVLFIIFMDRISRRSQGPEGVRFGNHRISSLLFADDVVLMASSSQDLQHVLERFAAECEAAGMRISTSKSEAMVLDRKRVEGSCLKWRSSSISGSCS
ncbi:hypothetical protein L3Q82_005129 [Scortum barcoo]|uniref:Uncharacterized protein n=1 Tax=Scortum barcoo TaxID=214431 RepID=A0ACB8VEI3_9TELE|nr:hypothetical protein L3Q82_005129 [Scortum barcoo]